MSCIRGKRVTSPNIMISDIPKEDLPKCAKEDCKGLLRPHIVWFGENLDDYILEQAYTAVENCDICLIIGTSSIVYPAAMFAPQVAQTWNSCC